MWKYNGDDRPPFAHEPGPAQESVWDYPRPPEIKPDSRRVVVKLGETVIASTDKAVRVLETASPPTFYLPPDSVNTDLLKAAGGGSFCEWKGKASYWTVEAGGQVVKSGAWSYENTSPAFSTIQGYFSFYPAKLKCYVDDELVEPQPGGFYGGWMTSEIVGPVKGEPGTGGW